MTPDLTPLTTEGSPHRPNHLDQGSRAGSRAGLRDGSPLTTAPLPPPPLSPVSDDGNDGNGGSGGGGGDGAGLKAGSPHTSSGSIPDKGEGTVLVYRQEFTLEGAIEFHAFAPVEALPCV